MILVSREEAKWLASQGCKYKNDLHKTVGVAEKCYLTEGTKWHKMLLKRRQSQVLATVAK